MRTMPVAVRAFALVVLCLALFVPGVARLPPVDRDEARYVQATRQMLESRDFVDIRFQSEPLHQKPVGIYWLQAASTVSLGNPAEPAIWTYRLPSLLGAITSVLLTAWIGARLFSVSAGILSGLLLASSLLLNVEARLATTDAALLACIVAVQAALASAHRAGGGDPGGRDLLGWGALAAGVLIKGPVAPSVCGATILALVVVERRLAWLAPLRTLRGLGVFLLLTLPWVAAIAYRSHGAFFTTSIGRDFLGKLLVGQESHGAPPGYYLLSFGVAFWPSSLLAGLALPWAWRNRRQSAVRFCLAWIVPTWVLCELAATKLPHYVLPVYPAIALLTGAAVAEGGTIASVESRPRLARFNFRIWLFVSLALAVAITALPIVLEGRIDTVAAAVGVVVIACMWIARSLLQARRHLAVTALVVGGALAFNTVTFGWMLPRIDSLWVSRQVQHLVERSRSCPSPTVAAVGYEEPSLVFLLGRATKLVGPRLAAEHLLADPACALALVAREEALAFVQVLAEAGVTPRRLGRVGGINYSKGRRVQLDLFGIDVPK